MKYNWSDKEYKSRLVNLLYKLLTNNVNLNFFDLKNTSTEFSCLLDTYKSNYFQFISNHIMLRMLRTNTPTEPRTYL